jgi:hypothetical protein
MSQSSRQIFERRTRPRDGHDLPALAVSLEATGFLRCWRIISSTLTSEIVAAFRPLALAVIACPSCCAPQSVQAETRERLSPN